jgi:hypothetical protein
MNSAAWLRKTFFFLLAFTLIEVIDQIDPALRQRLVGDLVVAGAQGPAY